METESQVQILIKFIPFLYTNALLKDMESIPSPPTHYGLNKRTNWALKPCVGRKQ